MVARLLSLNFPGTPEWRRRRAGMVVHPAKPTYDVYPDKDFHPEMNAYVQARDVRGRLLREPIELAGYSVSQLNFRPNALRGDERVCDWYWRETQKAMLRLSIRLEAEKYSREHPMQGQGLAEYALILALIAVVAIIALIFLGDQIRDIFTNIASQVGTPAGG